MTAGSSAGGLARNRSRAAFLAAVAEARRVSKPGSLKLISVHLVGLVSEAPASAPADIKEAAPRQGGFATVAKATAPSRFYALWMLLTAIFPERRSSAVSKATFSPS